MSVVRPSDPMVVWYMLRQFCPSIRPSHSLTAFKRKNWS